MGHQFKRDVGEAHEPFIKYKHDRLNQLYLNQLYRGQHHREGPEGPRSASPGYLSEGGRRYEGEEGESEDGSVGGVGAESQARRARSNEYVAYNEEDEEEYYSGTSCLV